MQKRNYAILLVWVCCWVLDHWLNLTTTYSLPDGYEMQYSFVGAIIGAVGSIAAGVAGSVAANNRRKQAEQELEKRKRELKEWRDAEMGSNYLDRADSRAAMRRVFEKNKEAQKALNTDAVKQGMTDEAKVAHAGRLNENYADVVSQIAGAGARHKDRVQQQYMAETRDMDGLKIQNMMDTSGIDNMVQGITGAAGSLGGALDGMGAGKGIGKKGNTGGGMSKQEAGQAGKKKAADMASTAYGMSDPFAGRYDPKKMIQR